MIHDKDIVLLQGIPTDINSSYKRGCSKAPKEIIKALNCDSSNMYGELGYEIKLNKNCINTGDLKLNENINDFDIIVSQTAKKIKYKNKIISLGGDHFITYPLIKAFHKYYKNLNIIHFDAHSDLYENFQNNPFSHASPFARIMEQNLASNLIQIGIRTLNDHQKQQAKKFHVKLISPYQIEEALNLNLKEPTYISIDLDALDPAFAPGVSHYEPGGLSVRDIIKVLHSLNANIVGADIVEYNPLNDINSQTAMVCAKLIKEIFNIMQKGRLKP